MKQKSIQIPWHTEIELRDQVKILEAIESDKELLNIFPNVVASGFNVIPLKVKPDSITIATNFHYNPQIIEVLSKIINKKIDVVRMNETIIFSFIERMYLKGSVINFPTFLSEDFLVDQANYEILKKEKVENITESRNFLQKDYLLVISLSVKSDLTNIDRPIISTMMSDVQLDTGFDIINDKIELYGKTISDDTIILVRKYIKYSGLEFTQDILTKEVKNLPYIIHPTEVQITSIDYDGTTSFYVYDRIVKVEPGQTARWDLKYYFLCYGYRHKREISVSVDLIKLINRSNIISKRSDSRFTILDLKKWLGNN